MGTELLKLYPLPGEAVSLNGLYLSHRLHKLGNPDIPFVYANFLSSLDGRIALQDPSKGESYVPKSLTGASDYRLFLELQCQADCLITHGGYLRALAQGKLGNILQVGSPSGTDDLNEWRKAEGFIGQPTIVVASASLDFPLPDSIKRHGQKCYIATGEQADSSAIKRWENRGYIVIKAGHGSLVEGKPLINKLKSLGYRSIYLVAGPKILETMAKDGQLCRLYHTITHQLLGGQSFHTMLGGKEFSDDGKLILRSLYFDQNRSKGSGQWFAQFDVQK